MTIIISKKGTNAKRIEKRGIEEEDYLQKYIYDNPEVIPMYDIKEDLKLLIVAREFPTESGPIDALALDEEGNIYLIETKLYKNPDKRTVVAQVLDYGASLWRNFNDFNEFLRVINDKTTKTFNLTLNDKLKGFFELSDEEVSQLLENCRKNLDDGNYKFVVLMDELHDRLKDLILFMNKNSQFDIYAVELEYYKFEEYEIMIPKLFGAQIKKPTGPTHIWDKDSFLNHVEKNFDEEMTKLFSKLYAFCEDKENASFIHFGRGSNPSVTPKLNTPNNKQVSLFYLCGDGRLWLPFGQLKSIGIRPDIIKNYMSELKKIKGFVFDEDDTKYPNVRLEILKDPKKLSEFIEIVKRLVKSIKEGQ